MLCHFPTKTLIYLLGHLFSIVLRKEYLGKLSASGIPIEKETQFYDTQPCKLQKTSSARYKEPFTALLN